MNCNLWKAGWMLGLLALGGCQKEEAPVVAAKPAPPKPLAIEVVKETERSRHFLAVNRQLELGGTLYAYADVDGDARKMADALQDFMTQMAAVQPAVAPYVKDYAALFTVLGLDDIKAVGLSSVPDGGGYFRNRVFFYTPEKRHGLLAGLGGGPAPFARLNLAPADTDVYSESEVDLPAVYATIRDVVGQVGGEKSANQMEKALKEAGQSAAISVLSLIQDWKGHSALVVRLDRDKTLALPPPAAVNLPAFSLLVSIDGLAPAVQDALAKSPMFAARTEGTLQIYELKMPLPLEGIKPVLAIEGSTLYVATSPAFLAECRQQKGGLAQQPEFQQALAHVGTEGNGLAYISPRFFTRLHQLESLNPQMPPEMKRIVHSALAKLPQPDRPLVTVRTNLPDGILMRGYWNRSLKQDVAMMTVYNPVTIGILAAMAIPAFEKVRTSSQEKVVLNNLRQLAAAAEQYYLENGVTTTTFDRLVGPERDKYIKAIHPVDGEDYEHLIFKQGQSLMIRMRSGKVIKYP